MNLEPRTSNVAPSTSNVERRTSNSLRRRRLTLALLILTTVLIYAQTLQNEFVYDDQILIGENPLFRELQSIPRLFVTDWWKGVEGEIGRVSVGEDGRPNMGERRYRPLAAVTYVLNYVVGGPAPWGYHLVNAGLHAGVTGLLYLLALALGWAEAPALVAAALFAVHPLHTEAVAWVVGRPELLMALSVLGGLWCEVRGYRGAALVLFGLGLLSKEQAVVLPVLLLLTDLCTSNLEPRTSGASGLRVALRRYGGYVAVLGAYMVLRTVVLGGLRPPAYPFLQNPVEYAQGLVWILSVLQLAGRYLWLSIWPAALSVDYSYNAIPAATAVWEPGVLWAMGAWGGLLGLGWWAWGRDRRISLAVGLTVVTFAPVANVLVSVGTPLAERLFYLPLAGLCLLAGSGYERLRLRLRLRGGQVEVEDKVEGGVVLNLSLNLNLLFLHSLVILLCLALTVRTILRLQEWQSDETLFASAVSAVPGSARARAVYGYQLKLKGTVPDRERALEQFRAALSIYPDYARIDPEFGSHLGDMLLSFGHTSEGLAALEQAFRVEPYRGLYLGLAHARLGHPDKAEMVWREALAYAPDEPEIRSRLSRLLIEQGRYAEGLSAAEEVLRRRSDFVHALLNKALALEAMDRLEEAAAAYTQVVAVPTAPSPARHDAAARLRAIRARLGQEDPSSEDCMPGLAGCKRSEIQN